MLTPPTALGDAARSSFPLIAIARLLQHICLSLLPPTSDFEKGPTTRILAGSILVRCCAVLRAVLDAVLHPEGDGKTLSGSDKAALLRSHCAALVDALMPRAAAAAAAAATTAGSRATAAAEDENVSPMTEATTAATKLLEHAILSLPERARATLPAFPKEAPFTSLHDRCEPARAQMQLHEALSQFARLSDLDASGPSLRPRLLDLVERLSEARTAAEAAGSSTLEYADAKAQSATESLLHSLDFRVFEDGITLTAATAAAHRLLYSPKREHSERQALIGECLSQLSTAGLPPPQ